MPEQHGGYREPANPASVSGPGALSARTDGGPGQPQMIPTGGAYGDAKAMQGIQAGAPMADASDAAHQPPPIVPLDAPSTMPNEPVTHGAALGPGAGPAVLGPAGGAQKITDTLMKLMGANDISGDIEELFLRAEALGQ